MKHLYEAARVDEIKTRLRQLKSDSPRQWGKMKPAQALAHCSLSMEWALGESVPPRMFFASLLGRVIKRFVMKDDEPMRRNSPTAQSLVVTDQPSLLPEQDRLCGLIDRFASGGPKICTKNPHSFFGRLTPEEWAILMYKHLDHHLRQFGV